jgi:hypothetical protein
MGAKMASHLQLDVAEELPAWSKYDSWRQVAGYFDGDGTVGFDIQMFTLGIYLELSENWRPQLQEVETFLVGEGIRTYIPNKTLAGKAHVLKILRTPSVIGAARNMLPFAFQKELELKTLIDYYNDLMTGNQVIEIFNSEVISGKRVGKIREGRIPYVYSVGRIRAREFTMRLANEANRIILPESTLTSIVRDHRLLGLGTERLAVKYSLSRSVIRRVLREEEAR